MQRRRFRLCLRKATIQGPARLQALLNPDSPLWPSSQSDEALGSDLLQELVAVDPLHRACSAVADALEGQPSEEAELAVSSLFNAPAEMR